MKKSAIQERDEHDAKLPGIVTTTDLTVIEPDGAVEKQTRTRRYTASVYLDTSDPETFYLIVAVSSLIHAVFEFNPKTCTAVDKSQNRMLMNAARSLIKDKSTLTKLASIRLETPKLNDTCQFHPDNFSSVFMSLFAAFTGYMPLVKAEDISAS
jgi:hypothetical protein